jgi:outer membrane protein TolC
VKTTAKLIILILLFLLPASKAPAAEEALTWQDCVKEALQNHPDLVSAKESIGQAEAGKKITESGRLPQVDARANQSSSKSPSGGTSDNSSIGINGTQLLYDGSRTKSDVKAASENIKGTEYNYQVISSQVRQRLRNAYVNLLKAQELIPLSEGIVKRRKDNVQLVRMGYESGREHKGSLLTAEANLAQAEFDLSQATRDLELAQAQLCRELGRPESGAVKIIGTLETADSLREKPGFEALTESHPLAQKLISEKKSTEYGVTSAKAAYYPQVSAQGSAGRSDSSWPPESDQWSLGLVVSYPLFEGGRRTAEIAQAQARLNKAQADERSGKDGLIVSLKQSWSSLQDAIDNVEVRKKFLNASEERSKIAQAQYSIGLVSFDNWTIIEDDLVRAEKDFLNAQASACLEEASWTQAKGEPLENEK